MQLTFCVAGRALQGQYKWMLYGDDDTLWFVNGVLELARKLDPTMPYIITGEAPSFSEAPVTFMQRPSAP